MNASLSRSKKLKKNVIISFLLKGITMVNGFILVPLYLAYLDKESYGIWLTIASMLTWINFFEIGLGNGLKNKLSEALAQNDFHLGKQLVSSAYFFLGLIILACLILFFLLSPHIDWKQVFGANSIPSTLFSRLVLIVFCAFFLNVFLRLIISCLHAIQEVGIGDSIGTISNLIILICICILAQIDGSSNILYVGIIVSWVPVAIYLISTFILFYRNATLQRVAPTLSHIKKKQFASLVGLGIRFFFISIATLILFQSTNLLIIQLFGPGEVVVYNVAYKYFSVGNLGFSIIFAPLWPALNEAWIKRDIIWITNKINQLLKIWIVFVGMMIIQLLVANWVIPLWTGSNEFVIPFNLAISLVLYFSLFSFGGIFNMFINALGKLKLQMISLLIGAALFIPLALLLVNEFSLGLSGLVIAMTLANFYLPIVAPIQYFKLIKGKAKGIWNS